MRCPTQPQYPIRPESHALPYWKTILLFAFIGLAYFGGSPTFAQAVAQPPLSAELTPNDRGFIPGYLASRDLPDSLALLPPPPAVGSPAFAADEDAYRVARLKRTPERLALATADAVLRFPKAADVFAPVLGISISEKDTPHLYTLLWRSLPDAGLATYAAKNHYKRTRPFALYQESCCVPEEESALKNEGSYPSGHASIGWAWALILTELVPERASALLKRGYEFGQSRVICGVHWQSDVDAGRLIGAAAVARLHSNPVFLAQMAEAKKEITAKTAAVSTESAVRTRLP